MTAPLYPPQRPLSIGEIIDVTFRIFRVTLVKCLPYALVAVVVEQLPNIYYISKGGGLLQAALMAFEDPRALVLNCLALVIVLFLCSVILLRQRMLITAGAASPGAHAGSELAAVLRRVPALVLLGILWCIAVFGWLALALPFSGALRLAVAVVMLLPGSVVMIALCASWPALILTSRTALESLTYSWRLTSGSLWRLSSVFAVAVILVFALDLFIAMVTATVSMVFAHGDVEIISAVTATALVALRAIVLPFYGALLLVVFGDLVVRKEGTDLAQRISATAAG